MIRMRKHPDCTWPEPYEDRWLDESEFQAAESFFLESADSKSFLFKTEIGFLEITFPENGVTRVRMIPSGSRKCRRKTPSHGIVNKKHQLIPADIRNKKNSYEIRSPGFSILVDKNPAKLTVSDSSGNLLLDTAENPFAIKKTASGVETLSLFRLDKDDRFFGGGGRISKPEKTGNAVDMFSIKVCELRGNYGGLRYPYFMNLKGYGFVLDNPWPHVYFDFGRELHDKWFFHTPDGELDFYILAGSTPSEIAEKYCSLTGYPALPPKWMLGLWISWVIPYDKVEEYIAIAERLDREKWPYDVMVGDIQWRGGRANLDLEGDGAGTNLEWDKENFGDGKKLISLLKRQGRHLCLHLNTVMFSGEVLQYGLRHKYLRKVTPKIVVPEVTSEAAVKWYWNQHRPRVDEGVSCWWTDNGERVDGTLSDGSPSRNLFGHLWNKVLFDEMEKMGREKRLVLSRSGWIGAQRWTLPWPGDTMPGVERFPDDLWWTLNCSISGIPFSTVDFGGFMKHNKIDGDASPNMKIMHSNENIIRRVANAMMLFPVPRIHGPAKLPWMYSEKVQEIWRFFLEFRYRLFPYIYSYCVLAAKNGSPVFRPLFWNYPNDRQAVLADDQVLCGDDLLFAPVMGEGFRERNVYLPAGKWINLWTGEEYDGEKTIVADAPLFEPAGLPVFVRKGSVLTMRPLVQTNREAHEKIMIIHIFPDVTGTVKFHDSPGQEYSISYRVERKSICISVENPLNVERKFIFISHGRNFDSGKMDNAISFPFMDIPYMEKNLEAKSEAEFVISWS